MTSVEEIERLEVQALLEPAIQHRHGGPLTHCRESLGRHTTMIITKTNLKGSRRAALLATSAIVLSVTALSPAAAFATEVDGPASTVLSEFRDNLVANGDEGAVSSFDSLSPEQRSELTDYFLGNGASPASPPSDAVVDTDGAITTYTDGDFVWAIEDAAIPTRPTARAAAVTRNIWGTQWFSFAGIKITETKVTLGYQANGANATKVNSYGCTVVQNADPLAQVTSSKSNSFISGGKATAKCKVVVKRGVPSPWGQVTWSTKEGVQVLTGNGGGSVVKNGWE